MSILPILTAKTVLKILHKAGYIVVRQIGSHIQLRHPLDPRIRVTIANHSRDLSRGTLTSILKQARLTNELFIRLLRDRK